MKSFFWKVARKIFYWPLGKGRPGYWLFNFFNFLFYAYVKIFRIRPKKDMACLVIISHRFKFIYFGIPKTATRAFMEFFVYRYPERFDIEWYEEQNAHLKALKAYPDYFKFSFTRNPWARTLSCYKSKIDHKVFGKVARLLVFYKGLRQQMPFSDFCEWLNTKEGSDEFADRHWLSQHVFIEDENGKQFCDFVGKYENLSEDLMRLQEELALPPIKLDQAGFISGSSDYRHAYTQNTRDLVYNRYKKDIERFGYTF